MTGTPPAVAVLPKIKHETTSGQLAGFNDIAGVWQVQFGLNVLISEPGTIR